MRSIKGDVIGIKVVGSPSAPLGWPPFATWQSSLVAWNYWKLTKQLVMPSVRNDKMLIYGKCRCKINIDGVHKEL